MNFSLVNAPTLWLPDGMMGEMIAHAYEDLPNECCGIIAGKDGEAQKLYRTRNSDASPVLYDIDPLDLLRIDKDLQTNDWEVFVIYHSHVAGQAYPSTIDVARSMTKDLKEDIFPRAHYVIVSLRRRSAPVARAYQIRHGAVRPEQIKTFSYDHM